MTRPPSAEISTVRECEELQEQLRWMSPEVHDEDGFSYVEAVAIWPQAIACYSEASSLGTSVTDNPVSSSAASTPATVALVASALEWVCDRNPAFRISACPFYRRPKDAMSTAARRRFAGKRPLPFVKLTLESTGSSASPTTAPVESFASDLTAFCPKASAYTPAFNIVEPRDRTHAASREQHQLSAKLSRMSLAEACLDRSPGVMWRGAGALDLVHNHIQETLALRRWQKRQKYQCVERQRAHRLEQLRVTTVPPILPKLSLQIEAVGEETAEAPMHFTRHRNWGRPELPAGLHEHRSTSMSTNTEVCSSRLASKEQIDSQAQISNPSVTVVPPPQSQPLAEVEFDPSQTSQQKEVRGRNRSGSSASSSVGLSSRLPSFQSETEQQSGRDRNMTRLRKLASLRRSRFEKLDNEEKERIRTAYAKGIASNARSIRHGLDDRGCLVAFGLVGLVANNDREQKLLADESVEATYSFVSKSVNMMDFVFQVLPRVREQLLIVRQPQLYEQFATFDLAGTRLLTAEQCLKALEQHIQAQFQNRDRLTINEFFTSYKGTFGLHFSKFENTHAQIDFCSYVSLARDLCEATNAFLLKVDRQVATHHGVPPMLEACFVGEITRVYHQVFGDHPTKQCCDKDELLQKLLFIGVVPLGGSIYNHAKSLVESQPTWRLSEILGVILSLRYENELHVTKAWEDSRIKDSTMSVSQRARLSSSSSGSGTKTPENPPTLIQNLGLIEDCCLEMKEILQLYSSMSHSGLDEEFGLENDQSRGAEGTFDRDVLRLLEIVRAASRMQEQFCADELDIDVTITMELRNTFANYAPTGIMDLVSLKKLLIAIRPTVSFPDRDLMAACKPYAASGEDASLDEETRSFAAVAVARLRSLVHDDDEEDSSGDSGSHMARACADESLEVERLDNHRLMRFDAFLCFCKAILL